VEVYRDAAAAAAHKETQHYPVWRDAVAPMMAGPRQSEVRQWFFRMMERGRERARRI
jgi:quinol monooxygenase YgiN